MRNRIIILLVCLALGLHAFGQKSKWSKPVQSIGYAKTKALAKNSVKIGDAYSAVYYYEKLHDMRPTDLETIYELASMYKVTRAYGKASTFYNKAYEGDEEKYKLALYEKGIMQKMQGKYVSAIISLQEFKKVGGKSMDKYLKKQLQVDIKGCDSALFYLEFPEKISVKNIGESVNNPHAEFGPVPFNNDQILFGSLMSDTVKFYDDRYEKKGKTPRRRFYTAVRKDSLWERQDQIEELNDRDYQMGKVVYSNKTNTYYFTKCKKDVKGVSKCAIYSSKVKNGEFQSPEKLPEFINLPGYTTTQPSVHYDSLKKREFIYFASDRPGTRGGLDIFYTYFDRKKKVWKKPKSLKKINTPATECTPFFNVKENALYFSSDGRPGMGGLDVFRLARGKDNRYLPIKNLGSPVNSPQDDLDYSVFPEAKNGFVVSNRPGGTPYMHETCCDDIFEVKYLPIEPFDADINLLVTDEKGDTLTFDQVIVEKTSLRTKKSEVDTLMLSSGTDIYALNADYNYNFMVHHDGYEDSKFTLDTKKMYEHEHIAQVISLKKLEEESEPETIVVLEEPVVKEEVPVAVVETPIEEVPVKEEQPIEVIPEEATLVAEEPVEVVKPEEETIVVPTSDLVLEASETIVEEKEKKEEVWPPKDTFKPEEKFRLEVHYAFDKYYLSKSDKHELDSLLIPYMKLHKETKAILSAHTDNWGDDTYNQYLSEKRAESVVNYLVSHGIAKERLSSKGYGESKPLVPNSVNGKDSIENRWLNRRTEVEVVY